MTGNTNLDANVIESVAEGVIFNNLSLLMDTHVNRLVVLRPNISQKERTDALISIFKFLGASYDFGFNFADTSQLFVLRFNIMPLMVKETYHSSLPNEQAILLSQPMIL